MPRSNRFRPTIQLVPIDARRKRSFSILAVVRSESFAGHKVNPGAVTKVSAFDPNGKEVVIWKGTDPTPPTASRGISKIPVKLDFATDRVKVYLDSPNFPGWNEIDAVGLHYSWGRTICAETATASCTYGNRTGSTSPYYGVTR